MDTHTHTHTHTLFTYGRVFQGTDLWKFMYVHVDVFILEPSVTSYVLLMH